MGREEPACVPPTHTPLAGWGHGCPHSATSPTSDLQVRGHSPLSQQTGPRPAAAVPPTARAWTPRIELCLAGPHRVLQSPRLCPWCRSPRQPWCAPSAALGRPSTHGLSPSPQSTRAGGSSWDRQVRVPARPRDSVPSAQDVELSPEAGTLRPSHNGNADCYHLLSI